MTKRVLILGGTQDATELAAQTAHLKNVEVITSLAGRTSHPNLPVGKLRTGGFGNVTGLINYLKTEQIDLLIDATHPFAAQISSHAATAAEVCQVPRLMLVRPAWQPTTGDQWIEVESLAAAAMILPNLAKRVFLTVGKELAAFADLKDIWFLIRMIEPPENLAISNSFLLLERGPFTQLSERSLLCRYKIEAIVSKNSGGNATYAKIAAARSLGIPVVMIKRPALPDGEAATHVKAALNWLSERLKS